MLCVYCILVLFFNFHMLDRYNDNLRKLDWKAKDDKGKYCTGS